MSRYLDRHAPLVTLFLIGAAIFILDQLTKFMLLGAMPIFAAKPVIPGFFNLVHVRNTGAAFSLLAGANNEWRRLFFALVSICALGVIVLLHTKVKREHAWTRTALALIFGGALGNLIDRLRFGEVIDFLDFYLERRYKADYSVELFYFIFGSRP